MGFLDKKGLKKVVDWVKEYVGKNSASKESLDRKQDIWIDTGAKDSLIPYRIIHEGIFNPVMFEDEYGNRNHLPYPTLEYKLRAFGGTLKNNVIWPSIFDMPWPNNEIPEWKEDHQYEIYIAGGRVVSVDDITPLVEEVTYTIETYNKTFNIGSRENVEIYINESSPSYDIFGNYKLSDGTNTVKIIGMLDRVRFSIYDNNANKTNDYIISKVDCSKMKSNNLHNVLKGLKVDEIIYPQACVGIINNPIYEFEAPEIDLSCLKHNELYNPKFDFKTDKFIDLYFDYITIDYDKNLFGENLSNIAINRIIYAINRSSNESNGYLFYYGNFSYLPKLKTLGTKYNYVLYSGYRQTNIVHVEYFANIMTNISAISNRYHNAIVDLPRELMISHILYNDLTLTITIKDKDYSQIIFANYIDFEYSNFININSEKVRVYTYSDIPEGYNVDGFEFIKVNDILEVPFRYAPDTWDDVKNYDDDGNVIE